MRLEHVEVAVDKFARAERNLVGEMNAPPVCLDRIAFERNLPGDVTLGVLVILTLDVNGRPDVLDSAHGVSGVIDGDPIDVFERRQHLGAQFAIKYGTTRSLVDEAVSRNRDDQHVAKL